MRQDVNGARFSERSTDARGGGPSVRAGSGATYERRAARGATCPTIAAATMPNPQRPRRRPVWREAGSRVAESQASNGPCELQAQSGQLVNVNLCASLKSLSKMAESSAGKKSGEPLAEEHHVCY